MNYCFSKVLEGKSFDEAVEIVTAELKKEGFGILNEIDLQATLKNKIDVDFKKYKILGACNPGFAHKALLAEDKIGLFLPCNVIVEEHENGQVEVSAIDPMASMSSVQNETLATLAADVQAKMKAVIQNLS
ncbi:DUF302 domain-containing protein [Arcticibacterium luteifluviistationis]|uniref:DUF302 domain-containing protein n=1 Tax=Arcticibacterium luteifluviistationis TaxID=1784714 RepID=A0A2Z4GBL3_9BACT|nr:DUF302 domain-containing protein [Arcticibacterium luteifluviistationis]AWV98524.1 hypothetical protein DJ013_10220 [Arcticibacterium luteifluviistationis]